MRMAAVVDVPKRVFAPGWLQFAGQKMSKSKATAIHPSQIVDTFGSDAYRYYFTRTIAFGSDGSFSWEHLSAVYTNELANGLGNLVSRVTAMVGKYFDGVLPAPGETGPAEQALADALAGAATTADAAIERVAIHEAVGAVADFVGSVNGYVTEQEPWKVAKDETDEGRARLATILYTAAESLRGVAVLHNAVMPKTSAALWAALGADAVGPLAEQRIADVARWGQLPAGAVLTKGAALFPRLEAVDGVIVEGAGAADAAR
jgi:methionyl-tRNA synthetase